MKWNAFSNFTSFHLTFVQTQTGIRTRSNESYSFVSVRETSVCSLIRSATWICFDALWRSLSRRQWQFYIIGIAMNTLQLLSLTHSQSNELNEMNVLPFVFVAQRFVWTAIELSKKCFIPSEFPLNANVQIDLYNCNGRVQRYCLIDKRPNGRNGRNGETQLNSTQLNWTDRTETHKKPK